MKKLISLTLAMVAMIVVSTGAKAYSYANVSNFTNYLMGDCWWCFDGTNTATANEYDTVRVSANNCANITAVSSSQAISGKNYINNTGEFTDVAIVTKGSRAGLTAVTAANTNLVGVFTGDDVNANIDGSGWGWATNSASATSVDTVTIAAINNATITHNATSIALSGGNTIVNTGNGCGTCQIRQPYPCSDPCGGYPGCDACVDVADLVNLSIDTGNATAEAVSVVRANTNVSMVSTGGMVSASVNGGGCGTNSAASYEADTVSVSSTNNATLNVSAIAGASTGENTIVNSGDFANAGITTGNASSDLTSVVVANTNVTMAY